MVLYIIKSILLIFSIISLIKTFTAEDTGDSFGYLFDTILFFTFGFGLQPIT